MPVLQRMRLVSIVALLSVVGCGGDAKLRDSVLSVPAEKIQTPFQGTIRSKQWRHSAVNSSEITYTIRADQIRRETVSTNILETVIGSGRAGVICRPRKNEVLLYCSTSEKKRYCRLTLPQYRTLLDERQFDNSEPPHHGFGHIFLDLPLNAGSGNSIADQTTIGGLKCDRCTVSFGRDISVVTIETDHCQRIQVPRDLLELVEPNIPAAVTGFPLFVRRVETIRQLRDVNPESAQRYKSLLGKLAKLASDGLEKALESGLEIVEIDTTTPDAAAFELPADYSEVADLKAFQTEFFVSHAAHDWD